MTTNMKENGDWTDTYDESTPKSPDSITHLFDLRISDAMSQDMFLPVPTKSKKLKVIFHRRTDYNPIQVALAKEGSPAYLVSVKEAVRAPIFMSKLNSKDRELIRRLARLNPPDHDFSKWNFIPE